MHHATSAQVNVIKNQLNTLFALAAAAVLTVPASAQNLIQNGSFESGSYSWNGSGGESLGVGSTVITDWTVVNAELAPVLNGNSYGMVAEDGVVSLDLTGYHDSTPYGGVQQTIATTTGQAYSLQFYVGAQNVVNGTYRAPTSVDAWVNGTDVGTFTDNITTGDQTWALQSYNFTAASDSTTIALIGTFSEGGQYLGLDNVSVQSVPEPSGLVLAAGSILDLVGLKRRRQA